MDFKFDSKKINIVSLIGTIMMIISIFFKFFSILGVPVSLNESIRYIILIAGFIGLVSVCLNKNLIALFAGIFNLIMVINRVLTDDAVKKISYDYITLIMDATHKYIEGFYLLLFGAIITIIGSIYWMSKNGSNIVSTVSTQDNINNNNILYEQEVNKNQESSNVTTSNEATNVSNNTLNERKNYTQIAIIGIIGLLAFMFIAYFSVGNWEQNYLGLWKYKRAWLFDAKGLNQINGKYYYFNDAGYMLTGKQIVNNEFHFFNEDGSAKEGWVQDGNVYHFCKEDGSIVKDTWIDTNNNISTANSGTFYLDEYGNMVAGQTRVLNGKTYEFDSQGYKMFTFRVTNVYFNTSSDSKEKMNALNIHQTVCCHYTIECDEYGAEGQLYTITYFPNGQSSKDKPSKCYAGDWSFSYTNGIYLNNTDGPTGNLTIQFYDMKNRLIGQGSVLMIK